jgi:hypothetical protein
MHTEVCKDIRICFMCIIFLYHWVLLNWFHVHYFPYLGVLPNIKDVLCNLYFLEICDHFVYVFIVH